MTDTLPTSVGNIAFTSCQRCVVNQTYTGAGLHLGQTDLSDSGSTCASVQRLEGRQPRTELIPKRLLHLMYWLIILFGIGLGAVWPSLYTVGAIFLLPAFLIFAISVVRPRITRAKPILQGYLLSCLLLTILEWTHFLLHLRRMEF